MARVTDLDFLLNNHFDIEQNSTNHCSSQQKLDITGLCSRNEAIYGDFLVETDFVSGYADGY